MFRQFAKFEFLIAVNVALLVQTATAQNTAPRTLSQRLEQFRGDLLGDSVSDDGGQDSGSTPPPAQKPLPTRPLQNAGTAKADDQTPTVARRPAAKSDVQKTATGAAGGSSRRTAQPGYKSGKSQPTPVEVEDEAPRQEPTLAKRPEPTERSEASEPLVPRPMQQGEASSPKLARRSQDSDQDGKDAKTSTPKLARRSQESAPDRKPSSPRLARSLRSELAPPANSESESEAKPQSKVTDHFKGSHAADADVLFSAQSPLISVEATGPSKILIGKPSSFVVKVRNAGDVAANNVVVTVNIPPFAEIAEVQSTAGSTRAAAGTERTEPFQWKIARFEPHSRETLTLKIIPRKSIPIDLAVQWTCSPEVSQTLVEVQEPKLSMTLSGPAEVHFGQTRVYKLSISNPGNGDAENVMVSLLPIGHGAEGSASHKIGVLKAGQNKSIEVELTARQAGALTIRAQAYADGGLRAEASEPVLVRRANLKLDADGPKVKYAGTGGNYRIHVTNPGDATAENVQITLMLPPQAKYVSSNGAGHAEVDRGKIVWNAGNVQPGGERMFEVQCVLNAQGDNRIQVLVNGDDELSASAVVNTRVEALADLKLEIRDPQGPIQLGDDAIFEVIIRNRGTKSAENIDLVVFFSEGLEATSVQGGANEIGRGQVMFKTISTLAADSETVLRVHARADRAANHVFRAELVCESLQTKLAAEETTRFYGEEVEQPTGGHKHGHDLQPVPNE
jgi:uncharacterized repeat protein (TIGR01451 family)